MSEDALGDVRISHKWEPIEDLPANWRELCRPELHAVHRQWVADRKLIRDEAKLRKFQEELAMRWAIETGIIERLYKVDRGVTVQILEAGLEALGQFHARRLLSADARALITDQREALEMVMDLVGNQRELTPFYIKDLHQRLTFSQATREVVDRFGTRKEQEWRPSEKGVWKKWPNNPVRLDGSIHEYCPPEQVESEVDQLLSWWKEHESRNVCAEVQAAWLHHRFAQIHPFDDGNGRVARAITSAVFLKADYLVLVIRDEEHRERYLNALESADKGDLKRLVDLCADVQIVDLQDAMQSIRDLRGETIVAVAESIAERLARRKEAQEERAIAIMDDLLGIAAARLEEAGGELERALGTDVRTRVFADDADTNDWWRWQIVEAARQYDYFADLSRTRHWVSLRLRLPGIEKMETRLVVSLHAVGRADDLQAVTAFLTNRVTSGEDDDSSRWESTIVCDHPFRFAAETARSEELGAPFREWLETTIENGLAAWGERL